MTLTQSFHNIFTTREQRKKKKKKKTPFSAVDLPGKVKASRKRQREAIKKAGG